ncbi:hypothetical protein C5O22_11760 [Treponema sp. J25]|nr:hypothetical protein C5O22_11760 [Treponema sp. J25]
MVAFFVSQTAQSKEPLYPDRARLSVARVLRAPSRPPSEPVGASWPLSLAFARRLLRFEPGLGSKSLLKKYI